MRELERALKAAGDPTRTRILKLLERGELCVCQIQAVLRLAPSTVSKHLGILKTAALVNDRRDGRWIQYSLCSDKTNPFGPGILALLRGRLDDEPQIRKDAADLKEVCKIPVDRLCSASLPPTVRQTKKATRRRKGSRHG